MTPERQSRLRNAVQHSYRGLDRFRRLNKTLAQEYAGPSYTSDGVDTRDRKFLNLIQQAIEAYLMVLVGDEPRATLTSHRPEFSGFAAHFQRNLNRLMSQIELGDTFEEWVRNAFFSVGVIKVHMADSGEVIAEGDILMDPGKPFASVIPIDDWVHDGKAKKWSECQFMGDMYRIPYDELFSGMYPLDKVEGLTPSTYLQSNGDRVEGLSQDFDGSERFEQEIDLADIYVPRDGIIYTFVVEDRTNFILREGPIAAMEWDGGETGPYHLLSLLKVPENVMPASIAAGWLPSEQLANMLMRKSARQAHRSKEIGTYTPTGTTDAKRIKNAGDGEFVEVQNPAEVEIKKISGVDGGNHAFMLQVMQLFNKNAGNIDQMLGLGASTDTVGQERIVAASASRREDALKRTVLKAATKVIKELARLLWQDEFTKIPGQLSLDGFPQFSVDDTWVPGERLGVFDQYDVQIDIYSMTQKGPAERASTLTSAIMQVFMPLMPILVQQGGTIDMAALTELLAENLDSPQLRNIVKFTGINPEMMQQPMEQRKAPVSNRTYTRRNVSGEDPNTPDPSAVAKAQEPKT